MYLHSEFQRRMLCVFDLDVPENISTQETFCCYPTVEFEQI